MEPDRSRVVVAEGVCDCHTIHGTHAHHRDFPEIQADGESSAHAVAQLINQLATALDAVPDRWHRDTIAKAIADVKSFAEQEARDFEHHEPVETLP